MHARATGTTTRPPIRARLSTRGVGGSQKLRSALASRRIGSTRSAAVTPRSTICARTQRGWCAARASRTRTCSRPRRLPTTCAACAPRSLATRRCGPFRARSAGTCSTTRASSRCSSRARRGASAQSAGCRSRSRSSRSSTSTASPSTPRRPPAEQTRHELPLANFSAACLTPNSLLRIPYSPYSPSFLFFEPCFLPSFGSLIYSACTSISILFSYLRYPTPPNLPP
mmetsp:Transcript_22238/g.43256  ORF Transcript_22238/g.43256 Transcript_22238/m.43256 type:complete len:227 (-) Transcript_22238:719-1399(-)